MYNLVNYIPLHSSFPRLFDDSFPQKQFRRILNI